MTQGAWRCIRSERPAWPLAYLRDVEVSLFLWESSLTMPAWDVQKIASLSTVSNGEQSLVCPSPPYFGNPPLSKSRREAKPWADESWDERLRVVARMGTTEGGVFQTVAGGLSLPPSPPCWWDHCLCLQKIGGGECGDMEVRSGAGRNSLQKTKHYCYIESGGAFVYFIQLKTVIL